MGRNDSFKEQQANLIRQFEKVVEIGPYRAQRKWKRGMSCQHHKLVYSEQNETIECENCNSYIGPFKAFVWLVEHFREAESRIQSREMELKELREAKLHLIAARKVEKAWRRKNMLPTCPHCSVGISPKDGLGNAMVHKDYANLSRDKTPLKIARQPHVTSDVPEKPERD